MERANVLVSAWAIEVPLWLPTGLLVLGVWVTSRRSKVPGDGCRICGYCLRGNVSGVCPECGTPVTQHPAVAVGRVRRAVRGVALVADAVDRASAALGQFGGNAVYAIRNAVGLSRSRGASTEASLGGGRGAGTAFAHGHLRTAGGCRLPARRWKTESRCPELRERVRKVSELPESGPEDPDPSLVGSIHPVYRCEQIAGGWWITENKWATESVYNVVLMGLIRVFGPMPGSYIGPFPSKDESIAAGKLGQPCSPENLVMNRVDVGDLHVQLDHDVGLALLGYTSWWLGLLDKNTWREIEEYQGPIRAAMCRGCLIVRFPDPDSYTRNRPVAYVFVVDPERGRPLVCYFENTRGIPLLVRWRE